MGTRAEAIQVARNTVTEITNGDVAGDEAISIQAQGAEVRIVGGTSGAVPVTTDFARGWQLYPTNGQMNTTIDTMFPGASYARLYAYASVDCQIVIYHG